MRPRLHKLPIHACAHVVHALLSVQVRYDFFVGSSLFFDFGHEAAVLLLVLEHEVFSRIQLKLQVLRPIYRLLQVLAQLLIILDELSLSDL